MTFPLPYVSPLELQVVVDIIPPANQSMAWRLGAANPFNPQTAVTYGKLPNIKVPGTPYKLEQLVFSYYPDNPNLEYQSLLFLSGNPPINAFTAVTIGGRTFGLSLFDGSGVFGEWRSFAIDTNASYFPERFFFDFDELPTSSPPLYMKGRKYTVRFT